MWSARRMVASSCSTNQDRVAARFELLKRSQQLFVVAGMQADGRFVEDIEHAAEIGSSVAPPVDALAFAAGQCGHAAAKLQVTQAHFRTGTASAREFGGIVPGNGGGAAGEFDLAKTRRRLSETGIRANLSNCRSVAGDWRAESGAGELRERTGLRRAPWHSGQSSRLPSCQRYQGFFDGVGARAAVHFRQ